MGACVTCAVITSIVAVFAVICLTIFAVLTASTVTQEKKLAEKYAASVSGYWACDSACADTANALGALWESGAGMDDIKAAAEGLGAETAESGDDLVVTYSKDVSEISRIDVTLRIGADFTVEQWRFTSADADWTPDESLPVWKG